MANTYLQRNMANSLDSVYTISMWVKRCEVSRQQMLFSAYNNSTYDTECFFDGDKINWRNKRNGSFTWQKKSNAKFRDTNSFYHFVFQNNQSNRKIYVNGVEITSWETNTDGSGASTWNNDKSHAIGSTVNGGADHFNGIISHMHFASGHSLAPTVFGSVDSVTGEWQLNTSPSFTPGSNGFTILKDGNTITDQSANSNNFALGAGAITNTKDCASNIMATLNPLNNYQASSTFTYGNNKIVTASNRHGFNVSTLGATTGKYYFEAKLVSSAGNAHNVIGLSDHSYIGNNEELSQENYSYGYINDGSFRASASNVVTGLSTYGNGDIISVAADLDNSKLYFRKNGAAWLNSGNPTSGSTGTGALPINNLNTTPNTDKRGQGVYYFAVGDWHNNSSATWETNFGNGYFGTTAITTNSGNGYAGAEGASKFAYAVPSGYSALNTKGLNQ